MEPTTVSQPPDSSCKDDDDSRTSDRDDGNSSAIPKLNRTYGSQEYWEDRFSKEDSFEWLLSYQQLAPQLEPYLDKPCRILVVGCGNAPFSADLYDAGYEDIVNIDYSATVIHAMRAKHATARPKMQWVVMDMTDMSSLDDASFDVVIDKAAMDALMTQEGDVWNPDPSVIAASGAMCQHVSRILRPGGHFLQISLNQSHFRKKYLLGWHNNDSVNQSDDSYSEEFGWTFKAEQAAKDTSPGCFGHFFYAMTKRSR